MYWVKLWLATTLTPPSISIANDYTYDDIANRHRSTALDKAIVETAKMQGECMVGLKKLNFQKSDKFNPEAEWSNYRSVSLLQSYSPCEVLIMMETARKHLERPPAAVKQ